VISQILPPQASAAEAFSDIAGVRLFGAEEAALGGASLRRYAEFSTGRACARAALAQLGLPPVPIPRGPRGEPQWPAGVTGSITHCTGYRACAVARSVEVAALGIDAEPAGPLPARVLPVVATAAERAWLAERMAAAPEVCWDTLLFSAKESAYKAWFPLTGTPLGFADVTVSEPADGRFTVHLLAPGSRGAWPTPLTLEGSWLADRDLIITAVAAQSLVRTLWVPPHQDLRGRWVPGQRAGCPGEVAADGYTLARSPAEMR
jgi:4'-phosphopantetheinyl transferase EntD